MFVYNSSYCNVAFKHGPCKLNVYVNIFGRCFNLFLTACNAGNLQRTNAAAGKPRMMSRIKG